MDRQPVVSVIVATYCSEETIIDTLDSIYNQTYPSIELIVTDDCSKDRTCEKVSIWISEHKERFINCSLILSECNTGVSANFNRGLEVAKGEWIKPFGGDDMLFPDYLVKAIDSGNNVDMVLTQLYLFKNDKEIVDKGNDLSFINKCSSEKISKYYARIHPFFNVPTIIVRRNVYDKIGYYDERSPYFEDVPFLMSFFNVGLKAHFLDEILVWYRVGGVSHQNDFERAFSGNKKLVDVCNVFIYNHLKWYNFIDLLVLIDQNIWKFTIHRKYYFLYKVYFSRYNMLRRFNKWISQKALYIRKIA